MSSLRVVVQAPTATGRLPVTRLQNLRKIPSPP